MPRLQRFNSRTLPLPLVLCGLLASILALNMAHSTKAAEAAPSLPSIDEATTANPRPRKLAPGVLVTIDPELKREELSSMHDVVELLAKDPAFSWAKDVRFTHKIWALEFSFKPLRFIEVDIPQPDGRLQEKLVWYLVYRIRNLGDQPVNFIPTFSLEAEGGRLVYADRLLPTAIPAIREREDRTLKLLNVVEITREIPPSTADVDRSVWGVVTWTDIDPRIDSFAIMVGGLTNAYRWQDPAGKPREIARKSLQLNFWRPGDQFDPRESEIRFGQPGSVDYAWIYR